jgi:hypothetical protein
MSLPFLILGYGVPKDIRDDLNYSIYLRSAFNAIYSVCIRSGEPARIVLCGGKTDMIRPYRRTEADEMAKIIRELANQNAVRAETKRWKMIPERRSLSTLDNLLFAREILRRGGSVSAPVTIFCEATRTARIRSLARSISPSARVIPIDFDQSPNRFLDPAFIAKKERKALIFDRWALSSPMNLKKHRSLFKEKITMLRKAGPAHHADAVREWWEKEMEIVDEIRR